MIPIIEVKGLSFTYPDGLQALHDISFELMPGDKTAILGANGAGKSTLLLHLNGILNGRGVIKANGLELGPRTLNQIRALVGVIFQNPDDQLFSPTVYEDVAYGPYYQGLSYEEIDQRVDEALVAVQMEGFAQRNPYHLSGGEKKRIAIATVLSMHPQVLIFDEPTAGLDPRARRELIQLLGRLPQTMLIATHDLGLALQVTPCSIILDRGRIVANGPTDIILQDKDFLFQHGLY